MFQESREVKARIMESEVPENLKALAAELDALGGVPSRPDGLDGLPDLGGTDFEPLAEIGRGGMGVVYAARQVSLDRTVAVKLIAPHAAADADFRERFLAEARIVARLRHPNIVGVYAAGTRDGQCYFAMEHVEGKTADAFAFSLVREVVAVGIALAEAVAYAHSCGVLHRDIKPSNVFIGNSGTVKLGDFGLACLADSAVGRFGTRKYMAPEVIRGEPATVASDQYSLGATLLELVAPLLRRQPDKDLAAILDKATRDDPRARYADLTALANDLRHHLAHEPVAARPASPVRRFGLWFKRNPVACLGTSSAVVCLIGFVVALVCGYVGTRRALAETERARQETLAALRQVEAEAGRAALSLAMTLTTIDRTSGDVRAGEIDRAIQTAEILAERFPGNAEIRSALGKLRYAKEAHRRIRERRGRTSFAK